MSNLIEDQVREALIIVASECDDDEGYIRNLVEGAWQDEAKYRLKKLGEAAIEPLIKALSSNNDRVVFFVASFLGEKKEVSAVEPLIKLLLNRKKNDYARQAAATAL